MHEKLKERESLIWNHTHPWPFSIEFLRNHGQEGDGWAGFHTRLSLYFKFLHITFMQARFIGR